jgi:uncharacterized membrane protein
MIAFLTMGIYTDFILKGRNHFSFLAFLIIVQMLFLIIDFIYCVSTKEETIFKRYQISAIFFGFFLSLATVLQTLLIPLFIAGRFRDLNSPWDLPLAG